MEAGKSRLHASLVLTGGLPGLNWGLYEMMKAPMQVGARIGGPLNTASPYNIQWRIKNCII
jgi:Ni/Fe-hydrogenase subunit HybB-like protein